MQNSFSPGIFFFLLSICLLESRCVSDPNVSSEKYQADSSNLISAQCGGCHLAPDPGLLDRHTWDQYVLPNMGALMGMDKGGFPIETYLDTAVRGLVQAKGYFPDQARMDEASWERIRQYFLDEAPAEVKMPARAFVPVDSAWQLHIPGLRLSPPSTTFIQASSSGGMILGDAHTQSLQLLGPGLEVQGAANVGAVPVDVLQIGDVLFVLVMGDFAPHDLETGYLMGLPLNRQQQAGIMIPGLRRPVSMAAADFNADGKGDWVIAEYGKWLGRTRVWMTQADGSLLPRTLSEREGPAKVLQVDWDQDGDTDILSLHGQGQEGIYWYQNDGSGNFKEVLLKQFPPTYGSVEIGLFTGNEDGLPDLWYVAGDMADYPAVDKPYHGAYFFQHTKDHKLKEETFIPLRGAYGLAWGDWDGDKKQDAALTAFFPDYTQADPRNFLLLKRTGAFSFEVQQLPFSLPMGRWLRVISGDMDQDGDMDLALGSLVFGLADDSLAWVPNWAKGGIPFVWLENKE